MPFQILRDRGEWSAYECGEEWGGIATREAVEAEVRRRQMADRDAAKEGLAIAHAKLRKAEASLAMPALITTRGDREADKKERPA